MAGRDDAAVGFRVTAAEPEDASRLAELRVRAMRPSLEAVGRFDPERARARFLATFDAGETRILWLGDRLAGVFVLRWRADHLYLDHLYVDPACQGLGLGRRVIGTVQSEARSAGVPVRLRALNGSPANRFYRSCGFGVVSVEELDTLYQWAPTSRGT